MVDHYRNIVHAIDHLLLAKPSDLVAASDVDKLDELPVVTPWDYEFNRTSGDTATKAKNLGNVIHVPSDYAQLEHVIAQNPWAFSSTRYVNFQCALEQFPQRYVNTWDVALDVLVQGEARFSEGLVYSDDSVELTKHVGIYGTGRGEIISKIKQRFLSFPQMVKAVHKSRADRYVNVGGKDREKSGSPYEIGDESTFPTQITQFRMGDDTDVNYWTLLWAHGLPEAFLGWWPTTILFRVTEHRQLPGFGSTGGRQVSGP